MSQNSTPTSSGSKGTGSHGGGGRGPGNAGGWPSENQGMPSGGGRSSLPLGHPSPVRSSRPRASCSGSQQRSARWGLQRQLGQVLRRPSVTDLRTQLAGFQYLAMVIDMRGRRVVSSSMGERLSTDLVLSALNMALTQRKP